MNRWGRALVTCTAVVAVVIAAAAAPAVLGSQTAPARSLVELGGAGGPASSIAGGGLGALSGADTTQVGGAAGAAPLASQDAAVHFVVESNEPAYWRTGAFDRYTGQGWERTGKSESFDGRFADRGLQGERVEYRVTLERRATALPTAWRPARVSRSEGVRRQPGASLSASQGLPAGTSYEGVSYAPASDPAVLRSAGRAYPDAVERRYLGLPDEPGTERLARFTTNLTSGTTTAYETAVRIERWLEANKRYSLNASHDPSEGTVASQFVFEMETGYCEYFATAMVAMLRSQGIPARYVVGYSTGQETAPGEYTVRAMNAHAWVEVYFPEVGWVKFDPTPGSDRLAAEQAAFANQTGGDPSDYQPTETGSPGEAFSPDQSPDAVATPAGTAPNGSVPNGTEGTSAGVTGTPTDAPSGTPPGGETPSAGTPGGTETTPGDNGTASGDGTPTANGTPSDGGTLSDTPTPGGTPSETDETPSESDEGLQLSLNRTAVPGASVAVTVQRRDQPVVGAVVRFNGDRVGVTNEAGVVVGEVPYAAELSITVVRNDSVTVFGWRGVPPPGSQGAVADRTTTQPDNDSATRNYTLDTAANVSVVGTTRVNGTVTVIASVSDVPIRNATVTLDGEPIGRTDDRGRVTLGLPATAGTYTVSVRRGAVGGNRTVSVAAVRVNATVEWPLAVPFAPVSVTATEDGEPLGNASVAVNGRPAGATGADGRATVRLPVAGAATVAVTSGDARATTTVSGVGRTAAGVLAAALALVGGAAVLARRRGVSPRELPVLVARVGRWTLAALVTVAGLADRGLSWLAGTVRAALADRDPEAVLIRLREWARRWTARARRVVLALVAAVRLRVGTDERAGRAADGTTDGSADPVARAWRRFVGALSIGSTRTRTPGEVARWAVDRDGLPAEPVATLRDAYRAVAYGGADPDRVWSEVRSAVAALFGGGEE